MSALGWRCGYSFFRQIMARAHSNARRCIPQVNVMPPSTMISDPKKSQKKDLVARQRGTWACGTRFLRLLF